MTTATTFGRFVRDRRETLAQADGRAFSLRQVAARVGMEPSYLSQIEREKTPPPGEGTIVALARELQEDPDVLLAMAGKLSSDLQAIVLQRPKLFADLLRQMKEMPDHAVLRVVREVRDGSW